MTNSQKKQLIQQHESPNWTRIKSLVSDGMDWDTAEHVDELERREAVLTQLGAAGELTDAQRDELDTVQSELHDLVGSPNQTYAGTSFAGDGAPAGTAEPELEDEDEDEDDDWMSVESVNEMQAARRTQMSHAVGFLTRYDRTGNDAALRIAIEHAQKATELEDRIDAALLAAIERETTPAP
jgi:hypothetical protein